jgi:hypothetical protein
VSETQRLCAFFLNGVDVRSQAAPTFFLPRSFQTYEHKPGVEGRLSSRYGTRVTSYSLRHTLMLRALRYCKQTGTEPRSYTGHLKLSTIEAHCNGSMNEVEADSDDLESGRSF